MANTIVAEVGNVILQELAEQCKDKHIEVTWSDFGGDPKTRQLDFNALAKRAINTYRSHSGEDTWKPISSAMKSPDIYTPIYLLGFVPDNASPNDPDSGVCVIWWEAEGEYWTSEAICHENDVVVPSHWLMQIKAPSAAQRGLAYERGFIPPQITDALESHKPKPKLLPCPCVFEEHGQAPQIVHDLMNSQGIGCEFAVRCPECDVSTPQFVTEEEAVYCWNTRLPNVVQQLQIEELVETLQNVKTALPVLQTMLEKVNLTVGAHRCVDMMMGIDMVLSQHGPQK